MKNINKLSLLTDETGTWEEATDKISNKDELEVFIARNIHNQFESFKDFFNDYVAKNNLDLPTIMKKSNIDKGYFYNILNGDRQPKRDKILCLCIGAGMDVAHINRGLRLGHFSRFDPKNERDLRIKYAVMSGDSNVMNINIMLEKEGLEILK